MSAANRSLVCWSEFIVSVNITTSVLVADNVSAITR
jgi:hypothetical protein